MNLPETEGYKGAGESVSLRRGLQELQNHREDIEHSPASSRGMIAAQIIGFAGSHGVRSCDLGKRPLWP